MKLGEIFTQKKSKTIFKFSFSSKGDLFIFLLVRNTRDSQARVERRFAFHQAQHIGIRLTQLRRVKFELYFHAE